MIQTKTKNEKVDLNLNMSIITFKVDGLNTSIKRQIIMLHT